MKCHRLAMKKTDDLTGQGKLIHLKFPELGDRKQFLRVIIKLFRLNPFPSLVTLGLRKHFSVIDCITFDQGGLFRR